MTHPQQFTPHREEVRTQAIAMYADGEKVEYIAAVLGIGSGETVSRWARKACLPMRGRIWGKQQVDQNRLRALHAAGLCDREIAVALGCAQSRVKFYRARFSLGSNYTFDRRCEMVRAGVAAKRAADGAKRTARADRQDTRAARAEHARRAVAAFAAAIALFAFVGQARAHSWYSELQVPGVGGSCCSNRDCAPADPCLTPDRKEGLVVNGQCMAIPWDKVLNIPSPDGLSHACYFGGKIMCVVLSGGS